ncbi:MAG: ydiB [Paenibacillus sp.]|jgi:tRNA threonylcarbamoyladenosine biosynthesis protein TsaE|nr:ydiB [Paenibacillus sp.]
MMEVKYVFHARSLDDTVQFAEALGANLGPGTVLALDGDLGAGKTRLSQAIAHFLEVPGIVNSPTFTIIKEYEGGKLPLYHMDVYRITQEEADELGLDEYFYGNGVTIVEWASRIVPLLPEDHLAIYIHDLGGEERSFEITPSGEPYVLWCRRMKENGILT